ncbi:MAG: Ig-like domain-containing protein [Bacteroidales bacterium]|nr:Ig-like domain-containing protein [Bacteroidales bacterium]
MRKFYFLLLSVLVGIATFAETIQLVPMEYNGKYYYQGEIAIENYKSNPSSGYFAVENTINKVTFTNFSVNGYVGELRVNIADISMGANFWTELNDEYAIVVQDLEANHVVSSASAKMYVAKTAANPREGEYHFVIQVWDRIEGVDTLTLTYGNLTFNYSLSVADELMVKSPIEYCAGADAVALSAQGAEGAVLTWYDADKNVLPGAPIPSTDVVGVVTYYVSQKNGSEPESDLEPIQVVVKEKLDVPTLSDDNISVCAGTPVVIVATSENQVVWINKDNQIVTTDKTLSQTEMTPGTKSFGVYAKKDNACNSDTVPASFTIIPVPYFTLEGSTSAGLNEDLTYTVHSETPFVSYEWYVDEEKQDETSDSFAIAFSKSGSYVVKVFAQTAEGCSATQNLSVAVSAGEKSAKPEVANVELLYCQNQEASSLEAVAKSGATLIWSDQSNMVLDKAPIPNTEYSGVQYYYVSQIEDGKDESDKVQITVTVVEAPMVTLSAAAASYVGDEVEVTATSSVPGGTFVWYLNGEKIDEEEVVDYNLKKSFTFNEAGIQTITIQETTTENGCSSSATLEYKVKAYPSITFGSDEYSVEVGESITINPIYVGLDNLSQLTWTPDYSLFQITINSEEGSATLTAVNAGTGVLTVKANYYDSETNQTIYPEAECTIVAVNSAVSIAPKVTKKEYSFCQGSTAEELVVEASPNATIHWYDASYNALNATPIVETDVVGTATYYVSQTIGTKEESEKVKIDVAIIPAPIGELIVFAQGTQNNPVTTVYADSLLTVSLDAFESTDSFVWTVNGVEVGTENQYKTAFPENGTYVIGVTQTSVAGCSNSQKTTIRVKSLPQFAFEKKSAAIYKGQKVALPVVETGCGAGTLTWNSANSSIVEANQSGEFSAIAVGTTKCYATKTFTDEETGWEFTLKDSCEVIVENIVETVICKEKSIEMFVGEHVLLDAEVHAILGNDYRVEVSDSDKAEVVDKMISALAEGEIKAYAICSTNEELRDTVSILIKKFISAKEISLPSMITIKEGSDTTLSATIIPADASYVDVVFMEKDDDVITVSADGTVHGKAMGTSIVTASTKEGLQAQTLVYVTSSEDDIVKIQLNNGEKNIFLKVGETKTVSCKVSPATIKANDLKWSAGDSEIADVSSSGVLTAKKVGEMFLYVSYKTSIDEKINVYVTNSNAPTISYIPTVVMQQPGSAVTLNLAEYVYDDSTAVESLLFSFNENENIAVQMVGTVAMFSLKNADFLGTTEMILSVKDSDNLTTSRVVGIEVDRKPNEAPIIACDTIVVPFGKFVQLVKSDVITDDYTPFAELNLEISAGDNLDVIEKAKTIKIMAAEDDWSGNEELQITVTDAEGLSTSKNITVIVQPAENTPPTILEIPRQFETDSSLFKDIDLSKYVLDDFTSPSAIVWSATTSENVAVKIVGSRAEIYDLNAYWRGAEVITFTAMDQGGLTSSQKVTFYREMATTEDEKQFSWYGKPQISIYSSRYYGTPGEAFTLIGTYYGTECTCLWEIPGVELQDPNALIQTLTFNKLGYYDVTFKVQWEGSVDNKDSVKTEIGVVGVANRHEEICVGSSAQLSATEGMDSYIWSNGATSPSIYVEPAKSEQYTLIMRKGLTTFHDTVDVRVSVPVQLPRDSVMCAGTTYLLETQDEYESYSWNTGATSRSIEIPAAVATYKVVTTDDMGCESSASFKVTKVNALPKLDLGDDKTLCDKETLTLDAGAGYTYDWNITKANKETVVDNVQSISLDSSAYVTVKITDENMCENFDTVNVTFTYPYPESIGVVTYSESNNNIIIAWERTIGVNTESYRVERQVTNDTWETVGESVPFSDFGLVVDDAANFEKRAYKYRLITTDGCGNEAMSGEYRSSYLQATKTREGKLALNWWTYKSANEDDVLGCYLLQVPTKDSSTINMQSASNELKAGLNDFSVIESFDATEDFVGWTDVDGVFKPGDILRVGFALKEIVYENAIKDVDGTIVEYQNSKSESGPFSLAISNIAEVENADAVEDLFPATVAVYPTVVTSVVSVAIVANEVADFNIELMNAQGTVLAKQVVASQDRTIVQIPMEQYNQGVYTVKISTNNSSKSIKIVK